MSTATAARNGTPPRARGKRSTLPQPAQIKTLPEDPADAREAPTAKTRGRAVGARLAAGSNVLQILSEGQRRTGPAALSGSPAGDPGGAAKGKSHARSSRRSWEPLATFVVEFQVRSGKGKTSERRTYAHHHEDSLDMDWPGLVPRALCNWMMERLGENAPLDDDSAPTDKPAPPAATTLVAAHPVPVAVAPARVETAPAVAVNEPRPARPTFLQRLRVLSMTPRPNPASVHVAGDATPLRVTAGLPFAVEITTATGADQAGALTVHVFARQRDTDALFVLGQASGTHGRPAVLHLAQAVLPAGSYQLICLPVVNGESVPSNALRVLLESTPA